MSEMETLEEAKQAFLMDFPSVPVSDTGQHDGVPCLVVLVGNTTEEENLREKIPGDQYKGFHVEIRVTGNIDAFQIT